MSIFEQASRLCVRYATPQGALSVEDLWHLPLEGGHRSASLEAIAVSLHHDLKDDTVSFVHAAKKPNEVAQLKFDIVKHVIAVRLDEAKVAAEAREKAERKQKLLGLLADKQDEELRGKSVEDLRALINEL